MAQYQNKVDNLEAQTLKGKDLAVTYNEETSNQMKQVEELKWNIGVAQRNKAGIENYRLASLKEKLIQEANLGFQYAKAAYLLEVEI